MQRLRLPVPEASALVIFLLTCDTVDSVEFLNLDSLSFEFLNRDSFEFLNRDTVEVLNLDSGLIWISESGHIEASDSGAGYQLPVTSWVSESGLTQSDTVTQGSFWIRTQWSMAWSHGVSGWEFMRKLVWNYCALCAIMLGAERASAAWASQSDVALSFPCWAKISCMLLHWEIVEWNFMPWIKLLSCIYNFSWGPWWHFGRSSIICDCSFAFYGCASLGVLRS